MVGELKLAFRFALRELRGGLSGFYVFLACIALGVAAISGVNAVALSITGGMVEEGRTLLGGDLAFRTTQRRLTNDERIYVASKGQVTEAANMRAMARLPDGSDQSLIELKAVDDRWPLVGSLITQPSEIMAKVQSGSFIVVDEILLARLDLKIGDKIRIGNGEFELAGFIVNEPDRVSDNFALGPKVIMSQKSLAETLLVQPGTIVNWTTKLILEQNSQTAIKAVVEEAKNKFPQAGWRIRSSANAAPALTRNIKRFSQFLTLVGLTALIVGGVGVANAVRAFLDTKRHVIASFKSLGAPARLVFSIYLIQILMLASIGIFIGLFFGALMPLAAKAALAGIIPVGSASGLHVGSLLSATAFGFLTALAFALWPLGQARDIPATALFRNAGRENANWPRPIYVVATLIIVGLLISLAVFQASEKRIALTFIGGIGLSFVLLRFVSIAIQWVARRLPRSRSTPLRLAVGNIYRPGSLTPSVVLSLGLGLALMVALALIQTNLGRQISGNIPKEAPDFFFVDIQSSEFEDFKAGIAKIAPDGILQTTPMLRGRIVSINDVLAANIDAKEGGRWVLRGDRGITYAANLPKNSALAKGEWWGDDYSGEPLVSFSAEEADEIGVVLGDKITINVLGREITAKVANLRHVEWQSLSINFVMVFSPKIGRAHV